MVQFDKYRVVFEHLTFELVLTSGLIILLLYIYYYYILYVVHIYYYYISYTILFYLLFSSSLSFPIFCSIPSSNIPLLFHLPFPISSSLHSQSFLSQSSIPPFPIQKLSIRVGIWISLFIFYQYRTIRPRMFYRMGMSSGAV